MGRTRLTQGRLAAELGISQSRVSQLRARGMPTGSVDAARRWRDVNLDPAQVYAQGAATARAPAPPAAPDEDFGAAVADLLDAAGERTAAILLAEGFAADPDAANLILSAVCCGLSDELLRQGHDPDPVLFWAGPLAALPEDARPAGAARIEALAAKIRAELAAADLGAE